MNKPLLYLLLFLIAFSACKKEKKPAPPVLPDITVNFIKPFNPDKLQEDVGCVVQGDSIKVYLPSLADDRTALVASFTVASGSTVKIGNVVQQSGLTVNDFSKPLTYTLTKPDGSIKNYKFIVLKYGGLPIFYLTTASPVVSKDDYVTGNLQIDANSQFTQDATSIDLQIKGRGNSTWDMPKKPYRLKFNKKAAMLGFPAAKNWVLLANYSDKTLMRNAIADVIGKQVGSNFAPSGRFVDIVMNGQYIGNYFMTQQVEVDSSRVNIASIKATDNTGDKLTGGYLLELDQRLGEVNNFFTSHGLPMNINTPSAATPQQIDYIKNYIQQTENAIYSSNFTDPTEGYAKYIDVDSFIAWYLVKETMKDNDGKDFSSIYYYKDRGGKLGMGPIWDFDLAAGNTDYSDCKNPTGWWIMNSAWFNRLFEDPAFKQKVKAKWTTFKDQGAPLLMTYIDKNADYLFASQSHNFTTWDILNTYVWPNPVVLGSYSNEVGYTKGWLTQRIDWMDSQIKTW